MIFPRAVDYHKEGKPLVPNGLGILYVLSSVVYLFLLHYLGYQGALTLAVCILFGGFLGLFDDWVDLKWRYKAFTPIIASIPLSALRQGDTVMSTYFFGKIDFGVYYYFVITPAIVTIVTNTVNQLGGLNGLETICPLIILIGFAVVSPLRILLLVPIISLLILAIPNYLGKIFVGNVGSFSFGITLASFAIIANIEQTLLISILPYMFNSAMILLNHFFFNSKASVRLVEGKLTSNHKRSLITLITCGRMVSERRVVNIIALLFVISTAFAVLIHVG